MSDATPTAPASLPFAEPSPLGLLGLAIGCAALLPIAFGAPVTPASLRTAAMFCLFFGAGCQFLAGLMSLANKNLLGGTLFTTFAFNWLMNWHTLSGFAEGRVPDRLVGLCVDGVFLVIFVVLTAAFAYHSKLLVAFLADVVALFGFRLLRELLHMPALGLPIALATVGLMVIALYMAFAVLLNASAGRTVLPMPGPLWTPGPAPSAP